jgi:hypothetical protein
VPLFPDLTAGEPQAPNGGKAIRFGDVDPGETRGMVHLLFSHQQPIAGAAQRQIDSSTGAYVEILKDQLKLAAAGLAAVGGISKLPALGMKGADRPRSKKSPSDTANGGSTSAKVATRSCCATTAWLRARRALERA